MKTNLTRGVLAGFVFVAMTLLTAHSTSAQYTTCLSPTVAYQPVYQPVATPQYTGPQYTGPQYTGWYPGKLFDRLRLRNYGVATATPTYANYTASYAPSYAPYTAGYTPYVTAYAPLRRRVVARPLVQTSYYYPQVAPNHCSNCVQTVARPVVLSPVVTTGCSTCAFTPCGGCSACSGVGQASYTQPGCSNCATSAPTTYPSGSGTVGTLTPQPSLLPNEPAPSQSGYAPESNGLLDPLPSEDVNLNDSTSFEAPRLLDPLDRTARRSNSPTVDVRNAVYHKSTAGKVSQTSHQLSRTQAEIDAEGWHSVPQGR